MYLQRVIIRERVKHWLTLFGLLALLSAPLWLSSCGKNSSTNQNNPFGANGFNQFGNNQFAQNNFNQGGCAPASGPIPIALNGIFMDSQSIRGGLLNGQSIGSVVVAGSTSTSSYNYRGGGTNGTIGLNILVQQGGYAQGGVQGGYGYVGGTGLIQLSSFTMREIQQWIMWGQLTIPGLIYQPNNTFFGPGGQNNGNLAQLASQIGVCGVGLNLTWFGGRLQGQVQIYFNGNNSTPYTMFVY